MRIIRRIKGKKTYFYLQQSFRKNGKVVTREKYLGRKMPRQINTIKTVLMRESREEIFSKLARVRKNFQGEWRKYPETVKRQEKEEIAIVFTYNTNAIEGSTITLSETREIIHHNVAPNKPLKDIRETEAHNRVFLDMLDEKEDITNRVLRRWHRRIFQDTKTDSAGQFRNYSVSVGGYIAPDREKVNNLMNRLVVFIRNADASAVELAARAHYRFEKIHPFGDGNGRIGRLIMNHILWRRGYPMLIVQYKKRKSYYTALARDEEGFVSYFLRTYLKIHKTWS